MSSRPQTQSTSIRPTTSDSSVRFKQTADFNKPFAPSFNTFYTTSAKVEFYHSNRIEGKSGYLNYVPSDNVVEQWLEKLWYENMNKNISEKRTEEEIKQTLLEWKEAKSRVEGELQRRKEHLIEGSNF